MCLAATAQKAFDLDANIACSTSMLAVPQGLLPETMRSVFLGYQASVRVCTGVAKVQGVRPHGFFQPTALVVSCARGRGCHRELRNAVCWAQVRIFGYLINADGEENWDEHAASFVLDAVRDAVPAGLVLGRLLHTDNPTVRLADAILASEKAFSSKHAVGFPFVGIWQKIRELAQVGLLETDLNGADDGDEEKLVKLFAWLDVRSSSPLNVSGDAAWLTGCIAWQVLLEHWREQLRLCKQQTISVIEREQKLRPDESGVLSWVRFVGMMREIKDDITDSEVLSMISHKDLLLHVLA